LFKYYAGVYDLYDVTQKPLYSGRISLHLLNPEPGYYGSSTFYGKDLLGIGIDEGTALVVAGGRAEVLGRSYVLWVESIEGQIRIDAFDDGDTVPLGEQ